MKKPRNTRWIVGKKLHRFSENPSGLTDSCGVACLQSENRSDVWRLTEFRGEYLEITEMRLRRGFGVFIDWFATVAGHPQTIQAARSRISGFPHRMCPLPLLRHGSYAVGQPKSSSCPLDLSEFEPRIIVFSDNLARRANDLQPQNFEEVCAQT